MTNDDYDDYVDYDDDYDDYDGDYDVLNLSQLLMQNSHSLLLSSFDGASLICLDVLNKIVKWLIVTG